MKCFAMKYCVMKLCFAQTLSKLMIYTASRDYIQQLNARILNELVEKIVVSEKEIIDGEKYQCVHIYYKFVGLMSI